MSSEFGVPSKLAVLLGVAGMGWTVYNHRAALLAGHVEIWTSTVLFAITLAILIPTAFGGDDGGNSEGR